MKKIPISITIKETKTNKTIVIRENSKYNDPEYYKSLVKIPKSIQDLPFDPNLIDKIKIKCPVTGVLAKSEHWGDCEKTKGAFGIFTDQLYFWINDRIVEVNLTDGFRIFGEQSKNATDFFIDRKTTEPDGYSSVLFYSFFKIGQIKTMEDLRSALAFILSDYYRRCRNLCINLFHEWQIAWEENLDLPFPGPGPIIDDEDDLPF